MTIQNEELFRKVLPVLQSKLEEIKYYEYDSITLEDIWSFCIQKKWRKLKVEDIRLHQLVETIFSVQPSEIVSHFQIQQFREENWFDELSKEELKYLLNPQEENKKD